MKINKIFENIQGEGRYAGCPALFIRLSGCNLNCDYCKDTYSNEYKEMSINELVDIIDKSKAVLVVWTGGEPTMQFDEMLEVIASTDRKVHHLETNGTKLNGKLSCFDYIAFSPKDWKTAKKILEFVSFRKWIEDYDIKIVTDLSDKYKELLPYATMLMPITTELPLTNKEIQKKVWDYCMHHQLRYSPRLQIDIFGNERRENEQN